MHIYKEDIFTLFYAYVYITYVQNVQYTTG